MESPASVQFTPAHQSALSPLREPLFRSLWIAAVISYTGSWMQTVATGWLMTSLTASPMWVSLVQVAVSLPVFLIALPAGALADIVDRRKFLLFTQSSMIAAATILGVMTLTRTVTPQILVVFTFLLGVGAVMNDPAWQSLTPDLVPPAKLHAAVALNSAGFNIARAVGPALGGLVIATCQGTITGSGRAFLINAVSFFGVILFLYNWKPVPADRRNGRTTFSGAIAVGLRYARQEQRIRTVLVRTLVFSLPASAFLALLPLIASKFGPEGFGAMLAFFGTGALCGAALLALARRRVSPDAVVMSATVVFAVALYGVVRAHTLTVASTYSALAGLAWIGILATLNASAQIAAPGWVRARVISMYVLVLQGGLALGSAVWGVVASRGGMQLAFSAAAATLGAGLLLAPWYRLHPASNQN
jgi:predicted MFS family arabinose efflux permease